ncbi:(2,3-dihydroxybenzoyl)adenylate synthase [uncultured Paenalcaligenes sp.]|uniref:(2,3-dihydroxybenzoyl)adenylate synthase n=1 Tax=uncultured Paenalcaligenes sp. TaxID=1588925 RepID=UPI002615C48B|nr:(2,3-dihydroxybenzoyl)adenylate synthase [uncultured Paenalcaligenes sp.]
MTNHIPLKQVWPEEFAQRYVEKGYWDNQCFGELLAQRAQQFANRPAVIGGETRWTYQDLHQKASAIAAGLLQLGLTRGARVLVQLPNIPEFISVVFALFRAGMVPIYALPAHRITELEHFANQAPADAYVCADQFEGFDYRVLARQLQERCPQVQHIIVVGQAEEFTSIASIEDTGSTTTPVPNGVAAATDVAFLQISGGSTGLSKLIPRTHNDYIYTLRESANICGLSPASIFLAALPIAHNFPMSSPGFLGTLYAGGCVVLSPSAEPETCFALIEKHQATFSSLVPPLLLMWLEFAPNSQHDISSLKTMQVGGAKLIPEVAKRVKPVLGIQLQQVFGMAEGLVNYTRLDDDEHTIITTQGRPISPDDEIRIVDDQDQPVAQGAVGHLLTRGPYTLRAYHNNPAANARSFTADGFYRTGDIVQLTDKGYLIVQGRANDHINRAGEKISAEEIEDHLLAHPALFDAAVVSVPDEYLGERSCAFLIVKNNEIKPRAIEIKRWIRERGLAEFKVPDQVVFVDSFDTTAAGKVSRKQLRAQLSQSLQQNHD